MSRLGDGDVLTGLRDGHSLTSFGDSDRRDRRSSLSDSNGVSSHGHSDGMGGLRNSDMLTGLGDSDSCRVDNSLNLSDGLSLTRDGNGGDILLLSDRHGGTGDSDRGGFLDNGDRSSHSLQDRVERSLDDGVQRRLELGLGEGHGLRVNCRLNNGVEGGLNNGGRVDSGLDDSGRVEDRLDNRLSLGESMDQGLYYRLQLLLGLGLDLRRESNMLGDGCVVDDGLGVNDLLLLGDGDGRSRVDDRLDLGRKVLRLGHRYGVALLCYRDRMTLLGHRHGVRALGDCDGVTALSRDGLCDDGKPDAV